MLLPARDSTEETSPSHPMHAMLSNSTPRVVVYPRNLAKCLWLCLCDSMSLAGGGFFITIFSLEIRYYRGFRKWVFATAEVLVELFREEKNRPRKSLRYGRGFVTVDVVVIEVHCSEHGGTNSTLAGSATLQVALQITCLLDDTRETAGDS